MRKFARWLRHRSLEPTTALALALLSQVVGERLPTEELVTAADAVTGLLIALGIIEPERDRSKDP